MSEQALLDLLRLNLANRDFAPVVRVTDGVTPKTVFQELYGYFSQQFADLGVTVQEVAALKAQALAEFDAIQAQKDALGLVIPDYQAFWDLLIRNTNQSVLFMIDQTTKTILLG